MANPVHIAVAGIGVVVVSAGISVAVSLGLFTDIESDDGPLEGRDEIQATASDVVDAGKIIEKSDGDSTLSTPESAENKVSEQGGTSLKPEAQALSVSDKLKLFAFDVVRVEASGDAVFAGRGPASSDIVLSYMPVDAGDDARLDLATALSSGQGDWATVSDRPLPEGTSLILIGLIENDNIHYADVRLLIEVPGVADGEVLIVEMSGDETSAVLSGISEQEAEAPQATKAERVTVNFVENDRYKLRLGGRASAEAFLRLYIDSKPVTDIIADREGRFHQMIDLPDGKTLLIRLDHIDASGQVVARAEVNYQITPSDFSKRAEPKTDAVSATPKIAITSVNGLVTSGELDVNLQEKETVETTNPEQLDGKTYGYTSDGNRVVTKDGKRYVEAFELTFEETDDAALKTDKALEGDVVNDLGRDSGAEVSASARVSEIEKVDDDQPHHVEVKRGDSLWRIATRIYGEGLKHTVIFKENRSQIRNPNLIYPGQVFMVPKLNRVLTPVK